MKSKGHWNLLQLSSDEEGVCWDWACDEISTTLQFQLVSRKPFNFFIIIIYQSIAIFLLALFFYLSFTAGTRFNRQFDQVVRFLWWASGTWKGSRGNLRDESGIKEVKQGQLRHFALFSVTFPFHRFLGLSRQAGFSVDYYNPKSAYVLVALVYTKA